MERMTPKPTMTVGRKVIDHYFPHQLTERFTPVDSLFASCAMGIPAIDVADWSLEITGLVETPTILTFGDLQRLPKRIVETVHVCSGNPAKPSVPLRRASNVKWGGVELKTLIDDIGVKEEATHIWAYGLDHGTYGGEQQDRFLKDMPLSRIDEGDVLIAFELNGAPLAQKNGFPARLVIPGFYGTNSVKWLGRLELADRRAQSIFTTKYYNDPDYDADPSGNLKKPVWALAPESIFVSPAPKSELPLEPLELWGWAWSDCAVRTVEVSNDGGETWTRANLEQPDQRSWQRFSLDWAPQNPGVFELRCRVTDIKGERQPTDGARNAIHSVVITISN